MCRPKLKEDRAPVTAADVETDEMIRDCLKRNLPPVVMETFHGSSLIDAERFILVDPLDGTPRSSLKFCVIEGGTDVCPRLAPMMEWNTAAGHAVLLTAGGIVTDLDGCPMRYGKPQHRNGSFVARGSSRGASQ